MSHALSPYQKLQFSKLQRVSTYGVLGHKQGIYITPSQSSGNIQKEDRKIVRVSGHTKNARSN